MRKTQDFYDISDYGDRLEPGNKMKIDRSVFFRDERADISPLTAYNAGRLQAMREESAAAEQAVFDKLKQSTAEWEEQAAQTLLIDKAIEYVKTPAVAHTSNKWEIDEYDRHEISNMVYKMTYNVSENNFYGRNTQKFIPFSADLTWGVYTNNHSQTRGARIAGQSRKRFTDKGEMERYLNGRIRAYAHLFTELSPPLPQEHKHIFTINGKLLPGYTVQGEEPPKEPPEPAQTAEPQEPETAADIGGADISEKRKEHEPMKEPFSIKLSNQERYENGSTDGAWLKLPATAAQLNAALARAGSQGKIFITSFEAPVAGLSLAEVQKAGIDELNFLAAALQSFDRTPEQYRISGAITRAETEMKAETAQQGKTAEPAQKKAPSTVIPLALTADDPRGRMKEATEKLEAGIKGIFESEQYKGYLNTISKFHSYSAKNCMLIAMQCPDASYIAGFNDWRDKYKRPVMKGEKGIKIFAPAPFKTKKEVDRVDAAGKPVFENGRRAKTEVEITVPAFKIATVFDVSQTEGEPFLSLGADELTGSVDRYKELFAALEKASPVPVAFEGITDGVKGYYSHKDKRIAINKGMSELQNLQVLIHEIAHSRLHDIDKNAQSDTPRPGKSIREVQAESTAFVVCQRYGLDTSAFSFGYIAEWSGSQQSDALKASLEVIRKEADAIIKEVDRHLAPQSEQGKEQAAGRTSEDAKRGLGEEVQATLQMFVDTDIKDKGAVTESTLEALAAQGYALADGKAVLADAQGQQQGQTPQGDTFTVYQLKDGEETNNLRFQALAALQKRGETPELANYVNVYTAPLDSTVSLNEIYFTFNNDRPEDFKGHSLSMSDVVAMNCGGKETAFYVDRSGFQELPNFLAPKERAHEQAKPIDLAAVADYMNKIHAAVTNASPDKAQGVAAFNAAVKRLEQSNERIPGTQPQLKALISHAAESTDLAMLKARMETLHTEFTQHYSPAVQMTTDTGGKADPPAQTAQTSQASQTAQPSQQKPVPQATPPAAQSKPYTRQNTQTQGAKQPYSRGKTPYTPKSPSIKDKIQTGKDEIAAKSTPAAPRSRTAAQNKNAGLGD